MSDVLEAIRRVYDSLQVLYYGTDDSLPRGKVFMIKETDWTHKAIICHPDDLPIIRGMGRGCRFVHLRDAPIKIPSIPMEITT
jgi:hypothetical protein